MANKNIVLPQWEVELQKPGGGVFFNFEKVEDAVIFASAAIKIQHLQNIIVYRCEEISAEQVSRTQIFNLKQS